MFVKNGSREVPRSFSSHDPWPVRRARAGQIRSGIERFTLDEALEAYRRLEAGELSGRAVVVP